MKTILTYNVNGIRAALGKGLADWLQSVGADIVCIQETKAQPEQVPVEVFEQLGYKVWMHSAVKKGYSGVALLSKIQPDHVEIGTGIEKYDQEGRVIRADFGGISVLSVYHPSGSSGDERQAFKMNWLEDFLLWTEKLRKERPKLIISGDYNICHKAVDIHDPVRNATVSGFLPEEREWMDRFTASGFIDTFRHFDQSPGKYTWWSYRTNARARNLGWRIDYNMATRNLEKNLRHAAILADAVHSDHCPVLLGMEF